MSKKFPKINVKCYNSTKLMNRFSYYITMHFILSNKDYNSYRNSRLAYQTYP